MENIEKNYLLQIVSIKNPFYSKFYADSIGIIPMQKTVFDFKHYILRYS